MAFDKSYDVRLWGVTTQNSTTRLPIGDSSGGTFTSKPNPLRGTLVWDSCAYVLQKVAVAGGATGGSYSLYIETDSVTGYTGLPIAGVSLGPNSAATAVMTSLHQSSASPLPTHLNIVQTAAGGGLTGECFAFAKQYRGVLSTPGLNSSERVIQGNLVRGASYAGGAFVSGKGFVADETVSLTGASATTLGLHKMRVWDTAFYWAVAGNSVSGSHDVHLQGRAPVSGTTFTIARTGTGGIIAVAGAKRALSNLLFGISPNPTAIIWDTVNAGGVSDARVVVLAKTGRGTQPKS